MPKVRTSLKSRGENLRVEGRGCGETSMFAAGMGSFTRWTDMAEAEADDKSAAWVLATVAAMMSRRAACQTQVLIL